MESTLASRPVYYSTKHDNRLAVRPTERWDSRHFGDLMIESGPSKWMHRRGSTFEVHRYPGRSLLANDWLVTRRGSRPAVVSRPLLLWPLVCPCSWSSNVTRSSLPFALHAQLLVRFPAPSAAAASKLFQAPHHDFHDIIGW